MNRIWSRFGLIVFSFFIGLSIVHFSQKKFQGDRNPAAIRQVFDFTNLRGSSLEIAVKERLIGGIEIHRDNQGFGLSFGHFAFQNSSGEKSLGCQEYPRMALIFEAEGYAVSGSKSTLEVEGGCNYSSDLAKINPLMIPMARILNEKPGDGDFNFQQGQAISLKFLNIPEAWPRKWVLIGVRMEGSSQKLVIERNEVAQILGHPLVLSF